jgi:hypothetical protein
MLVVGFMRSVFLVICLCLLHQSVLMISAVQIKMVLCLRTKDSSDDERNRHKQDGSVLKKQQAFQSIYLTIQEALIHELLSLPFVRLPLALFSVLEVDVYARAFCIRDLLTEFLVHDLPF